MPHAACTPRRGSQAFWGTGWPRVARNPACTCFDTFVHPGVPYERMVVWRADRVLDLVRRLAGHPAPWAPPPQSGAMLHRAYLASRPKTLAQRRRTSGASKSCQASGISSEKKPFAFHNTGWLVPGSSYWLVLNPLYTERERESPAQTLKQRNYENLLK